MADEPRNWEGDGEGAREALCKGPGPRPLQLGLGARGPALNPLPFWLR